MRWVISNLPSKVGYIATLLLKNVAMTLLRCKFALTVLHIST